jgi:hypothetical protein
MTNDEMALMQVLASQAAQIGRETKDSAAALESRVKQNAESKAEVSAETTLLNRETSGFGAPRFQGLGRVAQAFASFVTRVNDPESQIARDAAESAMRNYVSNMTGNTEKSANGGKFAGYVTTIRLADNAPRVINALDRRVKYWESVIDQCKLENTPESLRMIGDASRYCKLAGKCPATEGSGVTSDGKQPTHNGRPSRSIRGVNISYKGARPREAQLAELSTLFAAHGDAVLTDEFLDAFLDNGGKPEKAGATVQGEASRALQAIEFLVQNGGARSTDSAFLSMANIVLNRIASAGFGESQAADAAAFDAAAPETPTEAPGGPMEAGISFGVADPAPDTGKASKRKRGGAL